MSRPSQRDQEEPENAESFMEHIDLLYEELSFAIQWNRPSILLVFYESERSRSTAERVLEKRLAEIEQRLVSFPVDEGHFDIALLLSQYPDRDAKVFSVTGLARGGGKQGANAYRALNMRREFFVDYAMRVVFWLDGDEAVALSRHAPDFWAFRHRVVELDDIPTLESQMALPEDHLEVDRVTPAQPNVLDEQIEHQEAQLRALPKKPEFLSTKLDLIFGLAVLYRGKKAYDLSIRRLKQGIAIAKEAGQVKFLARFWGGLGAVCQESDQLYRAVRAYRKAIRLDPQEAGFWLGLGRTYRVEGRLSDAIIAFKQAIQLDPQNSQANSDLEACARLMGKDGQAEARREL